MTVLLGSIKNRFDNKINKITNLQLKFIKAKERGELDKMELITNDLLNIWFELEDKKAINQKQYDKISDFSNFEIDGMNYLKKILKNKKISKIIYIFLFY